MINNNGQVRGTIQIPRKSGVSNIPVSHAERRVIEAYFQYLKGQAVYQTAPSAPFFPMKDGRPYDGKQINRHLDRFADQDAVKKKHKRIRSKTTITLEKIKDAGLFRHYYQLTKTARYKVSLKNHPNDPYLIDQMIRETADFAGIKPRQAGSILQRYKEGESERRANNPVKQRREGDGEEEELEGDWEEEEEDEP